MAAERLSMRKIREVLRLKAAGRSRREIARNLAISHSTVGDYLRRAQGAGLAWPLPEDVTDDVLEARIFPPPKASRVPRPLPDWAQLHRELCSKRKTHITLQLLWVEYKEANPEGLQYSQFCELYRHWKGSLDLVLRQEHRAGEKVFLDYAGQTVCVVDAHTGEVREAQIFVAVLGASNYTYCEASWTQELAAWIGAHIRMFEFIGGVPELLVPDNLKSGVKSACFYDLDVNPTYLELATHYGTTVLPTRQRKPRDKAKVEVGVQVVERWVLARLRAHTFFTLDELNIEIARLARELNERPFQKLPGSRRTLFETLDRPALQPLPPTRYEFAQWKKARANIDYHIDVLGHFYSVPYTLARKQVDVRITSTTIEVLYNHRRVAAHPRSYAKGRFTTDPNHRPKSHQRHLEWTPSRIIAWGEKTGPATAELARRIMDERPHPEQGYRACLGLFRLGERYGPERLEAACQRTLRIGAISYRSVNSILQSGLDRMPLEEQTTIELPQAHEHVRGANYYATHSENGTTHVD